MGGSVDRACAMTIPPGILGYLNGECDDVPELPCEAEECSSSWMKAISRAFSSLSPKKRRMRKALERSPPKGDSTCSSLSPKKRYSSLSPKKRPSFAAASPCNSTPKARLSRAVASPCSGSSVQLVAISPVMRCPKSWDEPQPPVVEVVSESSSPSKYA